MALISVMLLIALMAIVIAIFAALVNTETRATSSRRDMEIARQNALFGLRMAMGQLQEAAGPDQRVTARAEILNGANNPSGTAVPGNLLWTAVWKTSNTAASDQNLDTGGNIRDWSYRTSGPTWLISAPPGKTLDPTAALSVSDTTTVTVANYTTTSGSATVRAYLVPIGEGTLSKGDYAYWVSDEGVKAKANITNPWAQTDAEAVTSGTAWLQNELSFMAPQRSAIEKMTLFSNYPSTKDQRSQSGRSPLLATDWSTFLGVIGLSGSNASDARKLRFPDVTFYSKGVLADARRGGLKTDLSAAFADSTWKSGKMDGIFETDDFLGPAWNALKSYGNLWQDQWWEKNLGPLTDSAQVIPSPEAHSIFSMRSQFGAIPYIQPYAKADRLNSLTQWYPRQDLTSIPLAASVVFGIQSQARTDGSGEYDLYFLVYPEIVLWNPYNVPITSGSWVFREATTLVQSSVGSTGTSRQLTISVIKPAPSGTTIVVGGTSKFIHPIFPLPWNFASPSGTDCYIDTTMDMGFKTAGDVVLQPGEVRRFGLNGTTPAWPTGGYWNAATFDANYPYVQLDPTNNADGRVRLPLKNFGVKYQVGDQLAVDLGKSIYSSNFELSLDIPSNYPAANMTNRVAKYGKLFFSSTYGSGDYLAFATNAAANKLPKGIRVSSPEIEFGAQTHTLPIDGFLEGVKLMGYRIQAKAAESSRGNFGPVFSQTSFRRNADDYAPNRNKPANVTSGTSSTKEYSAINMEFFGVKAAGKALGEDDDVFADVDSDSDGKSYFGNKYNVQDGASNVILFDIPRQPLLSVGALMHANMNLMAWDPTYAVGNSWPNILIPRSKSWDGILGQGQTMPLPDLSFYLNDTLFDGYFFSSVPSSAVDTTKYPPFTAFNQSFIDSEKSLPDARVTFYRRKGASPLASDVQDKSKAAANLLVDGAFNINSTSVEAWKAQLGALSGQTLIYTPPNGSRSKQAASALNNPFPRASYPTGEMSDGSGKNWTGGRYLTDAQIATLAQKIVEEVKARGPFLGLSDFINRRIGSDTDYRSAAATLESALQNSAVNSSVDVKPSDIGNIVKTTNDPNTSNVALQGAKGYPLNLSGNLQAGAGQPAWLIQNDLLKALSPILSARSDTFVIRCVGEKRSPSGRVIARAWCEAVVQRTPCFVDQNDPALTATNAYGSNLGDATPVMDYKTNPSSPAPIVNTINQSFGRRFEVISFRWMLPGEI